MCLWSSTSSGWLIAVFFAFSYFFVDGFTCEKSVRAAFLSYHTFIPALTLPVVIIVVCNGQILQYMRKSTRQVQTESGGGRVSHTREVRLFKVMVVTFVIFLVRLASIFVTKAFIKATLFLELLMIICRFSLMIFGCPQILPNNLGRTVAQPPNVDTLHHKK